MSLPPRQSAALRYRNKAKILAKESFDFSARIAILDLKHCFMATLEDPRTK